LFNNLNALLHFLNIKLKGFIQSRKIPRPSHWTREIKGCLVPPQVVPGQRREDVSWFAKHERRKEQAKNRPMG
jgi:hypothetical protein